MATTTQNAIEMLEAGIETLQSEEAWKNYLDVQARFHNYSFGNVLLILRQRPNATRVAGFHTWLDLGYHVRKGEKGIAILAPVTRLAKVEKEDGSEEEEVRRVVTFRVVYVFDFSQVDAGPKARPIPSSVPGCERLTADAPADLVDRLQGVAFELGYKVDFTDRLERPGSNGECDFSAKTIRILPGLSGAQTVKTFVHELAHAVLHDGWTPGMTRELCELEAESTAYVVCSNLGIDSSSYSFGYVSSWTGKDAVKLIRQSGERIQKAAHRILAEPVDQVLEVASEAVAA